MSQIFQQAYDYIKQKGWWNPNLPYPQRLSHDPEATCLGLAVGNAIGKARDWNQTSDLPEFNEAQRTAVDILCEVIGLPPAEHNLDTGEAAFRGIFNWNDAQSSDAPIFTALDAAIEVEKTRPIPHV